MNHPEKRTQPNSFEISSFPEWQSFFARTIFARHGRTILNEKGLLQGSSNSPLSLLGKDEVIQEADSFLMSSRKIARIISSPMLRATETAEIISSLTNAPIVLEPSLQEYNFGVLEGQEIRTLEQNDLHNRWLKTPITISQEYGFPRNSESFFDFLLRVNSGMKKAMELSKNDPNNGTLLVSHAMVTRAIRFLSLLSSIGLNKIDQEAIQKYEKSFFFTDPETQNDFLRIPHALFTFNPSLEFRVFSE